MLNLHFVVSFLGSHKAFKGNKITLMRESTHVSIQLSGLLFGNREVVSEKSIGSVDDICDNLFPFAFFFCVSVEHFFSFNEILIFFV